MAFWMFAYIFISYVISNEFNNYITTSCRKLSFINNNLEGLFENKYNSTLNKVNKLNKINRNRDIFREDFNYILDLKK